MAVLVGERRSRRVAPASGRRERSAAWWTTCPSIRRATATTKYSRTMTDPEVLWTPSPEQDRARDADALPGVAGGEARAARSSATRSCGGGRWRTSTRSGPRSSSSSTCASAARRRACSAAARCPARSGSRARCQLRRARVPRQARRRAGDAARLRAAVAGVVDAGASCARQTAAIAAGLRALGVSAGRPRRGVHAEHPRDRGRVARVRVDRGDLVLGGARVRRPQRDRPLRPDRAEGAAGDRRLPLRRAATSTAARSSSEIAGAIPSLRARGDARLPRRLGLGGRVPRVRRRADVRPAAVRSPAVGAVQLGHDRAAQADRPQPGRDPARAGRRRSTCTSTPRPATACSGSRRPAG